MISIFCAISVIVFVIFLSSVENKADVDCFVKRTLRGLSINILLQNTRDKMGGSFLSYSARDNNCQNFILALLQSNFLDNPRNVLFTKQSTSDLFDVNLRKITNTITDIAQKIDIIREGGSLLY